LDFQRLLLPNGTTIEETNGYQNRKSKRGFYVSPKELLAMKTIAIGSIFVLFAIVAGIVTIAPTAFADHATASVSVPVGTSVPGCEETNECYIPATATIDVGGEVTWSNDDSAAHTVTSGTAAEGPDGLFDSSLFMAGTTFSVVFDDYDTGTYPYFCMVHPWMTGEIIVQEAEAEENGMEGAEEIMVEITTSDAGAGEVMIVSVEITHIDGDAVEHVNYDVIATQDGTTVLDDTGVHDHDGVMDHTTMPLPMAASDASPVDVTVTFNGFGLPGEAMTGPVGEIATKQVVPEFGTIAMMILAVSIISIIAVTAKTRVIPRL
jgi:predicted secreted protein with PEFG-CTERM motif